MRVEFRESGNPDKPSAVDIRMIRDDEYGDKHKANYPQHDKDRGYVAQAEHGKDRGYIVYIAGDYGFIGNSSHWQRDLFFHTLNAPPGLETGMEVEFMGREGKKGPFADEIRIIAHDGRLRKEESWSVQANKECGVVVSLKGDKGFIRGADGVDVYFNATYAPPEIREGLDVEFLRTNNQLGPCARGLRIIGARPMDELPHTVQGSKAESILGHHQREPSGIQENCPICHLKTKMYGVSATSLPCGLCKNLILMTEDKCKCRNCNIYICTPCLQGNPRRGKESHYGPGENTEDDMSREFQQARPCPRCQYPAKIHGKSNKEFQCNICHEYIARTSNKAQCFNCNLYACMPCLSEGQRAVDVQSGTGSRGGTSTRIVGRLRAPAARGRSKKIAPGRGSKRKKF